MNTFKSEHVRDVKYWSTYLWWVKRIGFWDFYFKLISATLERKRKKQQHNHWSMTNNNRVLWQISSQVVSENTFIGCIWRTCYLPSQLCEVLIHQIYFYLVFTCLWGWDKWERHGECSILLFDGLTALSALTCLCQVWNHRLSLTHMKPQTPWLFKGTTTVTFYKVKKKKLAW